MVTHIHIETTSRCNAACEFCAHKGMSRPKEDMPESVFEAVLKDLSKWFSGTICPFLNGEPFMDPNFEARLDMLLQRVPNHWLGMHTNGALLTEKWLQILSRHRISYFVISLHALTPDQHQERTKLKGKWDHIMDITRKIEPYLKVKPTILFTDDIPVGPAQVLSAQLGGLYQGAFRYTWRGRVSSHHRGIPVGPCEWPFSHVFILSNGEVVPCCMDLEGEGAIGNVERQDLLTLHQRVEPYRNGPRSQLGICRGCNMPQR
jgi:hypothetical protein